MHYALLAGGKRIRPALMIECYLACGGRDLAAIMPAASSIECMHTYSLIHDDLPAMDNDDLRRGQPTCHKKFDEATAILAADALQALAFELVTTLPTTDSTKLSLIQSLAIASGAQGMVGGQMLDIESESHTIESILDVERIHLHKTGALLHYCCHAGALLARADRVQTAACSRYGKIIGLLFQVADDILDTTHGSATLGKSSGKDAAQNKATYVSILGVKEAKIMAQEMYEQALLACDDLGDNGTVLKQLAHYILTRNH
ncbi:MAG: polyprenyl synthetase family protein [Zetaproteobacteria bacterium]|nr:polyprenyl synthetase family protein [Zetaproteobacteria bacterium]